MKFVTGIVASLVIGSLSFGAFAAKEIQKDEVAKMNLTKIGSITTSRTTSPMDAKRDLSKKADELGGTYFVVIAGEKNEKTVHANADVYQPLHTHQRSDHHSRRQALPSGQLLQLPERQPSASSVTLTALPIASRRPSIASINGCGACRRALSCFASILPCRASISRTSINDAIIAP